jgi:hemolysin III
VRLSTNGIRETEIGRPICRDPGAIAWNYSRSETIADLTVHIIGLCFGFTASSVLLALAAIRAAGTDLIAALIYSLGLLSMLMLSAAYNLWPVCPTKWRLRRFDQSAIYVLIAATYTPFVLDAKTGSAPLSVLIGVWCVAALGIAVKLALPGRLDRLSIGVYVGMGWSAVILWSVKDVPIPSGVFRLLVAGGVLVTVGLIFHFWPKLRFQNAIWHAFVLLGISCHYAAVLNVVLS